MLFNLLPPTEAESEQSTEVGGPRAIRTLVHHLGLVVEGFGHWWVGALPGAGDQRGDC